MVRKELKLSNRAMPDADAREVFQSVDSSGDGFIDRAECVALLTAAPLPARGRRLAKRTPQVNRGPILCFPCLPVPSVYCGCEGN